MTDTPMKLLLDKLIADTDEGAVACQILFNLGGTPMAGAMKKGPIDGIYVFGTAVREMGSDGRPTDNLVMVDQFFEAAAVQRIIKEMDGEALEALEPSRIVKPGEHH